MKAKNPSRKRGFTLVELLIVMAIIGILIAMLLPALGAVREAARKTQCGNNFKQVGLALQSYHEANESFPPGTILWRSSSGADCSPKPAGDYVGLGWAAFILPFMEGQATYDLFDFTQPFDSGSSPNFPHMAQRIATYLCPSDPQDGELVHYTNTGTNGSHPDEDVRMSNMAGIADSDDWLCDTLWPKQLSSADGVMAERDGCPISAIRDGASNTLIVGEVTGGGPGSYLGHMWPVMNMTDTRDGINGPFTLPGGEYLASTSTIIRGVRATGPSSYHRTGCWFAMADGSVQFLSENIAAQVLSDLTTRAGGEVIPENAF
ncbi:MAG: DUF1559 domain-containing protein [Pirellulales bacterium]|nr:DUF1559 domain-containing protein [Pirellulales bacterium]